VLGAKEQGFIVGGHRHVELWGLVSAFPAADSKEWSLREPVALKIEKPVKTR